jgi:ABC-type antimicrobial peptide transport system permease subunit
MAAALTLAVGPIAGFVPAWRARKLSCIAAFRGE